ncbi:MAG: 50S ribosomal protein L23 [Opitutales bacterium]|jgi:large subunit ribosomal protein L23|nr:50S ribosomal protein L23 [Opitutales bacterium]|tara:strand:- start:221 stop:511 length:291 start_codon:yes stop_codon:yes gene_type:complete
MSQPVEILLESVLTEKATQQSANLNQYVFRVHPKADRRSIKTAVQEAFGVTVRRVNVLIRKPKVKRDRFRRNNLSVKSGMKKAIVTLKEGDKIDLL